MRILLAVNEDLIGVHALNLFLQALLPRHEVAVTVSRMFMKPKKAPVPRAIEELGFLERRLPLEQLFPLLEQANPTGEGQDYRSFRQWQHAGVELGFHPDIRTPEAMRYFMDVAPDLILSVRYGAIFRAEHLAIPTHGIWNIHAGLLPDYRGVLPTFRAMLQGREEYGITLHEVVDESIDTGGILAESRLPIAFDKSMLWNIWQLYYPIRDRCMEALDLLDSGHMPTTTPQSSDGAQYFTFPTQEEIEAFMKHHRMFDLVEYEAFLAQFAQQEPQLHQRAA